MDGADRPTAGSAAPGTAGATFRTTCPYCGVGCGVLATPDGKGGLAIEGDPDHPANKGRLCSKGSALGETLALEGRLLAPQIDDRQASWDEALDLVATRFKQTVAEHGPDSVAFYVSGQLLTEDYYVANKLMKGFIGSGNIDTNSRLCMASTVAGHKRAFGTDTVPGQYEDLETADLIVLVGSNLAWCHPVLFQRIVAAKAARPGMKVVTVDPRVTATTDIADMHLSVAPNGDVALFNYLLARIADRGAVDDTFVTNHVQGFSAALDAAQQSDAGLTGLTSDQQNAFADLWIDTPKVVTVFSQGVNQSSTGADKVNAIINCHLATGRIGKPGMGPFSVTGQPNAMGGREVGGLANMLANHLDIENADHRAAVQAFWNAPTIATQPGAKAVEMFRKVRDGQIKAIWIMCTNPVVSLPDAGNVAEALKRCDFVVISDMFGDTDTAKFAHVKLPATGWSEKDGTVTNSERVISRQRGTLPAPGQARHDWDIIADVGRRMGWADAFHYQTPADVFREYAAMSALGGQFGRDFDISLLSGQSDAEFDAMTPVTWPQSPQKRGGRFFGDGQFFTPSGKANMLALAPRPAASQPDAEYPLRLNTGRIRDQWHTMTRTGMTARLSQHLAEPFVEIHPQDARDNGVEAADLVSLSSPYGTAIVRALVTDRTPRGSVFVPMHWTADFSGKALVNQLVAPNVDPVSGQPESKIAPVRAEKLKAKWFGFAISRDKPAPDATYWARARVKSGWRVELASKRIPDDWEAEARRMLNCPGAEVISVIDAAGGNVRFVFLEEGRVTGAFFAGPQPIALSRSFLVDRLGEPDEATLAGHPGTGRKDPGAIVCSCFDIGINTIVEAIQTQNLTSVEAIGAAVSAGTNCGSCRPELAAILGKFRLPTAAE